MIVTRKYCIDHLTEKAVNNNLTNSKPSSRKNLFLDDHGYVVSVYSQSGIIVVGCLLSQTGTTTSTSSTATTTTTSTSTTTTSITNNNSAPTTEEKVQFNNKSPIIHVVVSYPYVFSAHQRNDLSEEVQVLQFVDKTLFKVELPRGFSVHTLLGGARDELFFITMKNEMYTMNLKAQQLQQCSSRFSVPTPVSRLCCMKNNVVLVANQFGGKLFNPFTGVLYMTVQLLPNGLNTFLSFHLFDDLVVGMTSSYILLWDYNPLKDSTQDCMPRVILTEYVPTALHYYSKIIYVGFAGNMINSYFMSGEVNANIAPSQIQQQNQKTSLTYFMNNRIRSLLVIEKTLFAICETGEFMSFRLNPPKLLQQDSFQSNISAKGMAYIKSVEELCIIVESTKKEEETRTMAYFCRNTQNANNKQKTKDIYKKASSLESINIAHSPVPCNETERLASLYSCKILDTPPDPSLDRIVAITANFFKASICLISLVDTDRQWFKSKIGTKLSQTHRCCAFSAHVIMDDAPDVLIVNDASLDVRFSNNPLVTKEPFIRFYAGAPLILEDNCKIGSLCVIDKKPRTISLQEKMHLIDFAAIVSDIIQTKRDLRKAGTTTIPVSNFSFQTTLSTLDTKFHEIRSQYEKDCPSASWDQIKRNIEALKEMFHVNNAQQNDFNNLTFLLSTLKLVLEPLGVTFFEQDRTYHQRSTSCSASDASSTCSIGSIDSTSISSSSTGSISISTTIEEDFNNNNTNLCNIDYNIIFHVLVDFILQGFQLSRDEIQVRFPTITKKSLRMEVLIQKYRASDEPGDGGSGSGGGVQHLLLQQPPSSKKRLDSKHDGNDNDFDLPFFIRSSLERMGGKWGVRHLEEGSYLFWLEFRNQIRKTATMLPTTITTHTPPPPPPPPPPPHTITTKTETATMEATKESEGSSPPYRKTSFQKKLQRISSTKEVASRARRRSCSSHMPPKPTEERHRRRLTDKKIRNGQSLNQQQQQPQQQQPQSQLPLDLTKNHSDLLNARGEEGRDVDEGQDNLKKLKWK